VNLQVVPDFVLYLSRSLHATLTPPFRTKDTFHQLEFVAWQSLPVILFCVCFAAVVTIIESSFHMKLVVQNDSLVPGFASLLILRELGVVVSSLLLTSRVGAGLAAEVGSMQITEQIDALRMLGINPIRFLVVPRLIACMVGGVILSLIANLVCLYCAMLVSEVKLGYSSGTFLTGMRTFVEFRDLIFAMIKGGCFGAVIPLISCFFGFRCQSGAEGVGLATTNSVVVASVTIIVMDFVLTYLFSHFY
jgi:phospholipid/cholesterol/gamma-HCH transport system permease protein